MSDETEIEKNRIVFNEELVRELVCDEIILKSFSERYIRINKTRTEVFIGLIAKNIIPIHAKDICGESGAEGFIKKNYKEFDKDGFLKKEERASLRHIVEMRAVELKKGIVFEDSPIEENKENEKIISRDDKYFVHKGINYNKFNAYYEDSYVDAEFRYDFNNPDLELLSKPNNGMLLQRVKINIVQDPIIVGFPIEYSYHCSECGWDTVRKVRSVSGTLNKIKCGNVVLRPRGEDDALVRCNEILHPVERGTRNKNVYYTGILFPESSDKSGFSFSAFSFNTLSCGIFECVLYSLSNKNGAYIYHIVDTKELPGAKFLLPEKKEDNYVKDLLYSFDEYIKEKTNKILVGLYPIKLAMILQKGAEVFGLERNINIQILGQPSTGKSMIMKYYGYLLHGTKFLSTMGTNISIPGLRGSKITVTLLHGDMSGQTIGYLGTKDLIHIDEVKESPELVEDLKSFLLEAVYSFNKHGGSDAVFEKKALVNTTANLDSEHIGQYCGSIKKAYREHEIKIADNEKEAWNEEWDLFLPLQEYIDNPYLYQIIKEKRNDFTKKNIFWMDGTEIALHQRFPFYFNIEMRSDSWGFYVIEKNITEGALVFSDIQIINVLKTDGINAFFAGCAEFTEINISEKKKATNIIKGILKEYLSTNEPRIVNFWLEVLDTIRIINKRRVFNDTDYELIKFLIENTNRKVFVEEMCDFAIKGKVLKDIKKEDEEIMMSSHPIEKEFGISGGEF